MNFLLIEVQRRSYAEEDAKPLKLTITWLEVNGLVGDRDQRP